MSEEQGDYVGEIVHCYRVHGIRAKSYRGRILVEREGGWEGPFEPESLRATFLGEIERREGEARAAVVAAIGRESEEFVRAGLRPLPMELLMEMQTHEDSMQTTLQRSGCSEIMAKLHTDIAISLYRRNELFR